MALAPSCWACCTIKSNASFRARRRHILHGRSWSGAGAIRQVEVSTDGGERWRRATLRRGNLPGAWVRWELPWVPRRTGSVALLARATDTSGRCQPDTVPFNDHGYRFWAVVRHPVRVTA